MNPRIPPSGDRLREFERLLREDATGAACDYRRMESRLFERIRGAEGLGALAQLRIEQTPPEGFWERVESALLKRLQNHLEYEEPIGECIAGPENLPDVKWQRLEGDLDEKLRAASRLESWERDLKGEIHLPLGRWEHLEERLLARIERHRKLDALSTRPFWLSLGFYLGRPLTKASAALALSLALALGAYRFYEARTRPIETMVYQAQGGSARALDSAFRVGRTTFLEKSDVRSGENGSLILVNKRGFVEMHNGSGLRIEEANPRKVRYRVAFSGRKADRKGNFTFFVNHRQAREQYEVATPDYRIDVVGTYFRVDPDLGDHVSTSVLEGRVRIHSEAFGDFEVASGQSLVYDEGTGRYRVIGGGRRVRRQDIESIPSLDELRGYGVVTVTSDVADAEVRIDDKYRGVTPIVVLLPPGRHPVQLSKEGHAVLDTSVTVDNGDFHRLAGRLPNLASTALAATSEAEPAPATPAKAARESRKPAAASRRVSHPAIQSEPEAENPATLAPRQEADLLYAHADKAENSDWQLAIALYGRVLEHPASGALRKEAALFSIARLRADHERDKGRATGEFLHYLALYPDGAFAGESWMRLAELEVGKDQQKAIAYYLRCIEKFPRHPRLSELQHRVGLLYLQNGKYDAAIAMFKQSLANVLYARESEKKKIYGSLYRALVAKGDLKNAELIDEAYRPAESPTGAASR